MSGHSKWATIKRAKGATDKKKGAAFTKLAKIITVATKSGGGPDPASNFKLRMAIDKAREVNMPKDTIERAIKRGSGETGEAQIENLTYEGFGPGGIAILVETLTDNKNRTVSNIKHIVSKHGGNLGSAGSVMWMFERKGVIRVNTESIDKTAHDEIELKLIEAGAQDIKEDESFLTIYTTVEELQKVKEAAAALNLKTEDAKVEYVPKEAVEADDATKEKMVGLFEELDADDDVEDFYTNANI